MRKFGLSAMGMVCALGNDPDTILRQARAGDRSGMEHLTNVLPDGESTPFGVVKGVEGSPRCNALLRAAAEQILPQIYTLRQTIPAERIAIVIGTSNSTMEESTDDTAPINMAEPALFLRDFLGTTGPACTISTACSSSAKAFSTARRFLESGDFDAALVGGTDSFSRIVTNGFFALEALSTQPTLPFRQERDGINLGEGAALFLLQKEPSQINLLGIGESSDAFHLTAPDPEGAGAISAMRQALADAEISPAEVSAVNLHGTGTHQNDIMENRAIFSLFGANGVPCASTKPMTGHTLGAAGAIELGLCWLQLKYGGALFPHIDDGTPDPEMLPQRFIKRGEAFPVKTFLSNSFAFGGSNASLLIGKDA